MMEENGDEALLTAVELAVGACPRLAPLRHVSALIHSSLFPCSWTLERAAERGFVRLLDRLLPLEWSGVSDHFRSARFTRAINKLLQSNQPVEVVGWWVTRYLPGHESEAVESAVLSGNVKMLEWLKENGICKLDAIDFDLHLSAEESDLAYWLRENLEDAPMSLDVTPNIGEIYPDYGFMEYVKWAVLQRSRYDVTGIAEAMNYAAFHGLLDDLKWIHDQTSEQCNRKALGQALVNGRLATAKWLYETYPEHYFEDPRQLKCDLELTKWITTEFNWKQEDSRAAWIDNSILNACRHGKHTDEVLRVVQFLYSIRPKRDVNNGEPKRLNSQNHRRRVANIMDEAASSGHLEVVKWLHSKGRGGCTTKAMDEAASKGLMEVVQWLHLNQSGGCTTKAMDKAAANGHLDVVQWLHANRSEGCTTYAMNYAAAHGYLEIVQWLHANRSEGCTTYAMYGAIESNHMHIVRWLHANRTEGCIRLGMDNGVVTSNLEMLKWLRDNQPKRCIAFAMSSAVARGDINVVKWIHESRSGNCTEDAMDLAAEHGHLDVMKYMHANRLCEWTEKALSKAIGNGHLDTVIWLMENGPTEPVHQNVFREAIREAALNGHLAVVAKLALLHGDLDWESDFLNNLANYQQFAVLEWALKTSLMRQQVMTTTPFLKRNT